MSAHAAKRAKQRYRRELVEHRLKKFTEQLEPSAVESSREFHLRHWLSIAEQAIQRDHGATFYGGLQQSVEDMVAEHPSDEFPPELQRAVLADLAFMEGHLQAFREVATLLRAARNRTSRHE
jgi:hypothetical protein